MKVCHMTSAHNAEDDRIFHKECISLARAGYETYLVARGESYDKNGVHIVGVGQPSGGRLSRMTTFSNRVYKTALSLDCDLYHFHDPELLPYGLKLKKKGKKVIFDSHEHTAEAILEKTYIPIPVRKLVYQWFKKQQQKVCKQLDAVISVTPNVVEYFKGINPQTWQIANFPIWQENVIIPTFKNAQIVFAGGISEQWNHHTILKILEKLNNCTYYLCGWGEESYINKLKSMAGWQKVKFKGKIPHDEVAKVLSESNVGMALLEPGRNSDWNNGTIGNTKIFEEMMAGLPVVCSDFVLWKAFVERYNCGICVNPKNVDEIASAIRYLLDNPDEARRMGENGRQAVKEEFNWEIEEKKLFKLYENIIND